MLFISILRFWLNGWITSLYVKPILFFPFKGMDWIRPLGNTGMHALFVIMAIAALCITVGLWYRVATILFFILFTYVELIDITNYLNHYYFISIVCFLMIWLPANRLYSVDCLVRPDQKRDFVPAWTIGILRLQLGLVYFFAGLAKLNADWLFEALPMKIWLPAKSHLPVVGPLMYKEWVAYLFSWFGAAYDLFIVFFLLNRKTRPFAYLVVLLFHLATALFFPGIGMFPYVMIVSSLVFFDAGFHKKILSWLPFNQKKREHLALREYIYTPAAGKALGWMLSAWFVLQILIPLRFLLYPGHLFWTEEGYRFSWRVMLMEKSGNTFFYVKEPATHKTFEVNNNEFLTPLQEKMMSTQPDMVVQYAHDLAKIYAQRGLQQPQVYATGYVALNGQRSSLYIDSTVNLATQSLGWQPYSWILPYKKHDQ